MFAIRVGAEVDEKRPVRVLIADAEPSICQGLTAVLAEYALCRVVGVVENGRDVLTAVMQTRPDVIVLEMQLPHTNGTDAIRQIKRQYPAVSVIALALHGTHRTEALAAGVDAFLLKGCAVEQLLESILRQTDSFHPERA